MLKAKCIQKFKKNNKVYGYRIQDFQGNTMDVYADSLKQAIKEKKIEIINLTLTSDNRLIDTKISNQTAQVSALNTRVPFIDTNRVLDEVRKHIKSLGWDDEASLVRDDSTKAYSYYEDKSYKYHKYGWDFGNFPILNSLIDNGKLICVFEIAISNDDDEDAKELAFFYDVNNKAIVFSVFSMKDGCTILNGDEKLCIAFREGNIPDRFVIERIVYICVKFLELDAESAIINWNNCINGVLPEYRKNF